jgi:hypothetical protein
MIAHTRTSASSLRLSSYVEKVADLTGVGFAAPSRHGHELRIDAACLHLAEVHSMPLHRIVEIVARAIARRARSGARAKGRGPRRSRRVGRAQGPMEATAEVTYRG